MTSAGGGYFAAGAPSRPRTPGELVVTTVVLLGTGALALLFIVVYAVTAPAPWVGQEIGVNAPNVADGVAALLMRPGRAWIRWAIVVLAALRCVTITAYYVLPGGLTYATFLLLPAAVLVAVHLPPARAYFRHAAPA